MTQERKERRTKIYIYLHSKIPVYRFAIFDKYKYKNIGDWGDGPVVKCTDCFSEDLSSAPSAHRTTHNSL